MNPGSFLYASLILWNKAYILRISNARCYFIQILRQCINWKIKLGKFTFAKLSEIMSLFYGYRSAIYYEERKHKVRNNLIGLGSPETVNCWQKPCSNKSERSSYYGAFLIRCRSTAQLNLKTLLKWFQYLWGDLITFYKKGRVAIYTDCKQLTLCLYLASDS